MARRSISIEDKINQQKEAVSKAKDRYDAAVAELEKLMKKRDEIRNKELLDAFASSDKSYDEIMEFLCTFRINGAPFPRQRCKRLAPAVRYPFVAIC